MEDFELIVAVLVRFKSVIDFFVNSNFTCQSRFLSQEVYRMIKEPN